MNRREWLLELARSVGPDQAVSVPAGWLLEALGGTETATPTTDSPTIDLTVEQVAKLFGRRSTSTVRVWCEKKLLPGAYKMFGTREWRVPVSAVEAFQAHYREGARHQQPSPKPNASTSDLGDWRKHRRPAA